MISVDAALARLFALVSPLGIEEVALTDALGRTLSRPVSARRDQPPFAASAMDGYAVPDDDPAPGATWTVAGESAAGHGHGAPLAPGTAIRIFTGAPVPPGTARVVIQEDTERNDDTVTLTGTLSDNRNIRAAGVDFRAGDTLEAPRVLAPADLALLAAMNVARVPVARRPVVALIATGDELVTPGDDPAPDQIVASNSYGLHGLLRAAGAEPRLLPIARDDAASLRTAFSLAAGADLIVTIGGASVGDHDLVGSVAADLGMEQSFWKVAMRPGKPLMAGRIDGVPMIGLPGNPVSAMVCGEVFLVPVIRAMLGHRPGRAPRRTARLAAPLAVNGPREHYLRARSGPDGVVAFDKQDSSLLSVLSQADCLIVQPPNDTARDIGAEVEVVDLRA